MKSTPNKRMCVGMNSVNSERKSLWVNQWSNTNKRQKRMDATNGKRQMANEITRRKPKNEDAKDVSTAATTAMVMTSC